MLKQIKWAEDRSYRTGSNNEPVQFYLEALCNSNSFDLLLGYFSSAAINILALGFASFLYSGGRMRLIINNVLSQKDLEAIKAGSDDRVSHIHINLSDFDQLYKTLDEYGKHFFECLSWLIANNRIQFVIISPKHGLGVSHYKSGIFYNDQEVVGFKASCNFTAFGLLENLEELDAFLSWENSRSTKWINGQANYFEKIFSGKANFVNYLETKDINVAIQNKFTHRPINELLIQERELISKKCRVFKNNNILKTFKNTVMQIKEMLKEPKFPYMDGPREYQIQAYEKWKENNCSGIFAMATGTGKTITSLNCVLREAQKNGNVYRAIILVPTITLVEQWATEAKLFNFQDVYKISSKIRWENEVSTMISNAKRIPISFIIICTYASFVKEKFQSLISNISNDTIFIADEGHNLAASSVKSKLKNIKLTKRIGLSATPKRIYDPEGTKEMQDFFDDSEPYIFSFSIEKAIKEGVLTQYYYYPHIIKLTEEELETYLEISKKLAKLYRFKESSKSTEDMIEKLLLKRKRIIHKASNKIGKTIEILKEQYINNTNLKYTFVYVPEGSSFEIREQEDEIIEDNVKLINQYTREIAKIEESIMVNQFIGGMADRDEVLQQFEKGFIHVIASMKCLDEGVDIPRAETAIFCSSTGNPRQFIQRRGRILRKHPDKKYATIHDLVVIPDYEFLLRDSDTFETEKKLIRKELERVMYFASLARNPYLTEDVFNDVCIHYGLNIYTIQKELEAL